MKSGINMNGSGVNRSGRWRPASLAMYVIVLVGVMMAHRASGEDQPMSYHVERFDSDDGEIAWGSDAWRQIKPIELRHHMGERPAHFPPVHVKIAYDDVAIYVAFDVDDHYVRAVATEDQGAVYEDSCVEFFFTPSTDVADGYFNLEMNCGGTMLLHFQRAPGKDRTLIAAADIERIEVVHDMPKIVEPEIEQPTRWSVAYRLPFEILEKYFPAKIVPPAAGVVWRANVYKCADGTSHPHWLTWSPVRLPQPDFHRPEWFGTFVFE
jgi:hypothetical protein